MNNFNFIKFLSEFNPKTHNENLLMNTIGSLVTIVENQEDRIKSLEEQVRYTGKE